MPLLLGRVQAERAADRAHQVGSVELRTLHAVIGASLNDLSNRFLIRVLGQQDEWHCAPGLQKLREQLGGRRIDGLMFKQDQSIVTALEHGLGFFQ